MLRLRTTVRCIIMAFVRWKQPLDCVSIPDAIAADLSNVITSAWISRMAHKPEAGSGEDERGNRVDPTSYTGFEQKLRQRRCIKVAIFRALIVKSYVF